MNVIMIIIPSLYFTFILQNLIVILSIQKVFQALVKFSNFSPKPEMKLHDNIIGRQEKYIQFGNSTEERISHSIKAMTRIRFLIGNF